MLHHVPNFLDESVLKDITQRFESARGSASFEVNNMGRWGAGLESGSYAPVLIMPLEDYKDYFIQKYQTVDPAFQNFKNLTCFLHIWLPGSQINWHHDSPAEEPRLSSTIYINPTWNWNWGGLFLYDDVDLGLGWVFPHYNKMIWFKPPVWHSTSMVTNLAEFPRLSIQLFFSP
jgi:hypothetical protein